MWFSSTYGPWLRANQKSKTLGGKTYYKEHVPFNPKYAQDTAADSGQAEQSITQRFKSTAVSTLMEDGEDGKESNAYLKTINAVDCDSSKSHEIRDPGATLDTSLPIENKKDVTENEEAVEISIDPQGEPGTSATGTNHHEATIADDPIQGHPQGVLVVASPSVLASTAGKEIATVPR
ncbi:hypothetical protein V6N13_146426 [Hibiscus sabdariffa]